MQEQFEQATTIAAYKALFLSSERGRKVLYDIAADCGVDTDGFSRDPYETAYLAGRRSVIITILSKLNTDVRDLLTERVTIEDIE